MKEKPVCANCGSEDIRADASAEWDVDAQEWVLLTTYDDLICGDCSETSINWVKVSE